MLDARTGNLTLKDSDTPLGEDTQREPFLSSPLGKPARKLVINGEWRSYYIKAVLGDGNRCTISLYFYGTWLQQLHFSIEDTSINPDAPDCGERQKQVNDRWLATNNISTTEPYAWGMVGSVTDHWDPRSSDIIITYKKHTAPPFSHVFEKW
jgi:hypothetical protein